MKFARLGPVGAEVPVVITDDGVRGLASLTTDLDAGFWETDGPARVAAALAAGELPLVEDAGSLRIGAPIARPGAIVCIGMNYAAHAAESGAEPPSSPVIFFKAPNTLAGPNDPVTIPRGSTKTDWEVELGVVIGKRASYLDSPAESLEYVAGFVVANDLSERAFQIEQSGGQWSKGKIAAGFSPVGPWLVTPDQVEHQKLQLRSFVNGEPRQDSSTADQIFDVATVIHHLSQYMVLDPGDLIMTGTPEGVALSGRFPYLNAGDVVEVEIDGLGRQRQEYVAYEAGR
ncbi:fumarylacetoacetate hydrolase family protein [Kribbella solani]|uniref:2-keto-4-pentenoate hydratase/2-oxohepta-3-ene-1,7-dioic acid hydratase in catechol pathway n=1 Tax=Kribbella solani TaxID=236067 RepID=A0A841DUY4_9ACTN|nr:fumarylacetoacetate hydrolase family protein [Kribbella solani]MBB5980087.1 2-keto-4-pentenoate hydratase/2-oxohepta-3-ene-1,7-dioic acid hydratase in catechol pathway [Kribbella solani]MDX2974477.1 fumarylacetoacetate hydrolase family protein [Kribbella solani]MDX3005542.1 fumarylacetoacetate hydrolase family protein [Kribbella solani]